MTRMTLHGQSLVSGTPQPPPSGGPSPSGAASFRAADPASGRELEPVFHEATGPQIDAAAEAAAAALDDYNRIAPKERAAFLDGISRQLEALGEELIERASQETALPPERLRLEGARTINQLRMFAWLVEEGSWVDARIDTPFPDRKPPRPDLRRLLVPIGPVAVFGASNFPLAFSVAGGDTASALAAGCPVVVKAHPAHPGTSELVAGAIAIAAQQAGVPAGVFSLLHGKHPDVSLALVRHPLIKAVGFTGSLKVGRALFDAAAARPEPIPVYAEMGSINPVFVLPGALAERGAEIAEGLKASVTMGVGQFCTNPGLVIGYEDGEGQYSTFKARAAQSIAGAPEGVMLNPAIRDAFLQKAARFEAVGRVSMTGGPPQGGQQGRVRAVSFSADAQTFLREPELSHEVFGPSTLLVTAHSREEVLRVARGLAGQLTATVHGTERDLEEWRDLLDILRQKAGRLVFNGFPTGVEVSPAMQHGGPYPATTDPRTTSVGTAAAERFVRPVCYQDFPQAVLPPELRDENPRGIWRLVDGQRTRAAVTAGAAKGEAEKAEGAAKAEGVTK